MEELQKEYSELLSRQVFNAADLDYTLLEHHTSMLAQLARVSNSGVTVFDLYARKHVFASFNFVDLFGPCVDGVNDRVHPDDAKPHLRNAIEALKYFYAGKGNMKDYKMITEYRIRNTSGEYVRVIEQFTLLEPDPSGNAWLALSLIDLSPDQSAFKSVKSSLFHLKNNTFIALQELYDMHMAGLTPREINVLRLIKDGLLSKEISEQLFISVHTVNTHRQRILEKLDVNNSMEAVRYASALGLLS
ncbi:MAG: LuxR C-terminal-related transcriptional regulator [Tannerella sp.]|jgi:DNA-binding CsgD family transcriptional regulator|nr:LuxR C-terminal-related transcriptional regulator [Tannerella sp.]